MDNLEITEEEKMAWAQCIMDVIDPDDYTPQESAEIISNGTLIFFASWIDDIVKGMTEDTAVLFDQYYKDDVAGNVRFDICHWYQAVYIGGAHFVKQSSKEMNATDMEAVEFFFEWLKDMWDNYLTKEEQNFLNEGTWIEDNLDQEPEVPSEKPVLGESLGGDFLMN